MHKNTYAKASTMTAIAISAILLTSFTMVGMHYSQRAMAQAPPSGNATGAAPPGNATGAAPPGNATGPSAGATTNATSTSAQEPAAGQSFVWQGTKSSQPDPASGHEKEHVAAVLIPRADGAVYSGVLTYSASRSVAPEVWHNFAAGNTSAIPTKTFGTLKLSDYQGKKIAITDLTTGASGSVPFSGNAILLHAGSPFTVTYTVNAVAQPAQMKNNVSSAMALAAPPTPSKLAGGSSNSSSGSSGGGSSSGSSGGGSSPPRPLA